MDYRTRVDEGIIYGRVNPDRYFGSAAIAPQGDTITPKEKESEMPVSKRVDSKFVDQAPAAQGQGLHALNRGRRHGRQLRSGRARPLRDQ